MAAEFSAGTNILRLTFDQPIQGPGPLASSNVSFCWSNSVRTTAVGFNVSGSQLLGIWTGTFDPCFGSHVSYSGGNPDWLGTNGGAIQTFTNVPVTPL